MGCAFAFLYGAASGSVCVDQSSRSEGEQDIVEAGARDGKASLAAPEHAGTSDHRLTHVPGSMDHDRASRGVAVRGVEPVEMDRTPMASDIHAAGPIRSCGCGVRTGLVGESFEPARMGRV